MNEPLVSVCLITYNHAPYLRQAIESVLAQKTSFSTEFIIADDFSTDGARDIIKEYVSKDPGRIHAILRDRNIGAGPNFIEMLQAAKGKYIAYLEGDDYWTDPNKLQKQIDFLEQHPDFALCFHQVRLIKNDILGKEQLTQA